MSVVSTSSTISPGASWCDSMNAFTSSSSTDSFQNVIFLYRVLMPVPSSIRFNVLRSEEHTSELQSLPTRRSSDLVRLDECIHQQFIHRFFPERDLLIPGIDARTQFHPVQRAQIGRAHV